MKRHTILYGRIAYSLIIAVVYFLGRRIPIPWGAAAAEQGASGFEALLGGVTGESQTGLTLLSLGLTPWICASIFVQVLSPLLKRTPGDETSMRSRLTAVLTLIFTVGLAVVRVQNADLLLEPGMAGVLQKAAAVTMLTAGASCIVWLARRNEVWGIGGQKLLIVINLTETLWDAGATLVTGHPLSSAGIGDLVIAACGVLLLVLIIALTVYFQKKEYRYPVHRLMIDSRYAEADYLAVRYNPAGTMPVMYTMALFSMLGTYAGAWTAMLPDSAAAIVTRTLALQTIPGLILFLILFRTLTEVSAVFTIDPAKTADDLKRSGSYIEGKWKRGYSKRKQPEQDTRTRNIHPGEETEGFLRHSIRHASNISAAVMGMLILLPLAYGILSVTSEEIGSIPVTIILLTGMLIELIEEGGMYYAMQEYRPILKVNAEQSEKKRVNPSEEDEKPVSGYAVQERRIVPKEEEGQQQPDEAEPSKACAAGDRHGTGQQRPEEADPPQLMNETEPADGKEEPGTCYFASEWEGDRAIIDNRTTADGIQQADIEGMEKVILPAIPVYDDTVHQLKMFYDAGEKAELIATSYLPQLRHFLHHHGLEKVSYWSAFDRLQGITLTEPAVLLWQDLDWARLGLKEKGAERNLVWSALNGVMHGYLQDRLVFRVHFTADGTVYYVDHFEEKNSDGRLDRRSIYDDRGFLSSSIQFKAPGNKTTTTIIQKFYNPEGDLQFEITCPSGRVTPKAAAGVIGKHPYKSAEEMVLACQRTCLEGHTNRDVVFLAAKGSACDILRKSKEYTKQGQKLVLSFYGKRKAELLVEEQGRIAAEKEGKTIGSEGGMKGDGGIEGSRKKGQVSGEGKALWTDDIAGESIRKYREAASMIITDTEQTRELIECYVNNKFPVVDVYPFEMSRPCGRNGSTSASAVFLFMPADWMFAKDRLGEARLVMKHIEFLMEPGKEIHLLLGTERGRGHLGEFRRTQEQWFADYREYKATNAVNLYSDKKGWRWLQDDMRTPEMKNEEEKVRSGKERELREMHDRIDVVSYQTEEELDLILESARLVVDPRSEPDFRLQLSALCYGIPQVVCASTRYVRHTENGYLCNDIIHLESGLHYYLDGLFNWNRSHDACAQMMQEYTEESRAQTVRDWKRQIAKGVRDDD